ncbi:DUF1819 family protein [Hoeflea sp. YIM 152468]|uniref:DUF1819 family protein n=1 Tax=Hoeflea sp. YIM 152468 TaxID=3031759 RepID=UPI0023D9F5F5|nr:DUF1819 family protein [Hoeflea sp. YIM 152468]MDF1607712.1 DUF1819 family protein [Hoeflea sp. YIM 152468]
MKLNKPSVIKETMIESFEFYGASIVASTPKPKYLMSFSTGGLFINESVELAALHRESEAWKVTLGRAIECGLATLPKAASKRRTLREITNRISCLSAIEREFLISEADRQEQQAVLWLATCRAYRFIHEFAVEVVRERHLSWRLELGPEAFDVFFGAKAEWDGGLAAISKSTQQKLRQVLYRMMREAGLLSEDGHIQTVYLSPRLKSLIVQADPDGLEVFPGGDSG